MRQAVETLAEGDEWRKLAAYGIVEDLYLYQTELTTRVMDAAGSADTNNIAGRRQSVRDFVAGAEIGAG